VFTDLENGNLDKQIIFKLGAIESEVRAIGTQLTDSIHKLSDRIDENSQRSTEKVSLLEAKVDRNAEEIQRLKDWKNSIVAKITGVGSAVAVFWLVFGKAIENQVNYLF